MKKIFILALLAFSATAFAQSGTVETEPIVVEFPETMAQFPGGDAALYDWLSAHIQYPESCEEAGIDGRVSLKFHVEPDGSIGKVEIQRSPHEDLSKEAERVIRSMPKWKPATQGGRPVRSYFSVPITFRVGVEAIKKLHDRADNGEAEAQGRIAEMYLNGNHLEQNLKKAEKYALLSANQGDARGANMLVCCYYNKKDFNKVVKAMDKYLVPSEEAQQFFIDEDAAFKAYPQACMKEYLTATYNKADITVLMKTAPKKVAFISRWNTRPETRKTGPVTIRVANPTLREGAGQKAGQKAVGTPSNRKIIYESVAADE